MNTNAVSQEELFDEKRARDVVDSIQSPEKSVQKVINEVIHDLGLGRNLIYDGKVTTCVVVPDKNLRIHIRRPTISTHDVVRGVIAGKDQTVNLVNNTIMDVTADLINMAQHHPSRYDLSYQSPITVQDDCEPFKYEHVLRQYLAKSDTGTSLYYHYFKIGTRDFCGHRFPDGLKVNQKLRKIYDTPSTKGEHDESVAPEYLYKKEIITQSEYESIFLPESLDAFKAIQEFLNKKNLVLVDTKMEFGKTKSDGRYVVIDEVVNMDSSRIWMRDKNGFFIKTKDKEGDFVPVSFSKQYARDLAVGNNFFSEKEEKEIAVRYVLATQLITGKLFEPDTRAYQDLIREDLQKVLSKI